MKAERIRIVMLFKSLMLSLPLSISFLFSSVFLSATLSLSQSIFIFFYFFMHFCPATQRSLFIFACSDTLAHTNTFSSCSFSLLYPCFHLSACCDWLKPELLKGHTPARRCQRLTSHRTWFDEPLPELASPQWDSALGFPVNEVVCVGEG